MVSVFVYRQYIDLYSQRMLRECDVLQKKRHPNVVRLIGFVETGFNDFGLPSLVYEELGLRIKEHQVQYDTPMLPLVSGERLFQR